MRIRIPIAIVLGLLLGLAVSAFTYFNDAVIRQTMFIGNFLPISVFGLAIVALLLINPLLRLIHARLPLTAAQVAIIAAIGLAACGWPGSNLFRTFIPITALPHHLAKNKPAWQGSEAMSYVPGASPRLGLGHVEDWPGLTSKLVDAADQPGSPLHVIWSRLSAQAQHRLRELAAKRIETDAQTALLSAFNDIIAPIRSDVTPLHAEEAMAGFDLGGDARRLREQQQQWRSAAAVAPSPQATPKTFRLQSLAQARATGEVVRIDHKLNRMAMVAAAPEHFLPAPRGEGLVLNGDRLDPYALDTLVTGWDVPDTRLGLSDLPWDQWWPSIRLWGGLVLSLGLAALCAAMIVHVQWSRRELLAYPIARFVDELAAREEGGWLPAVAKNRMFWLAMVAMLAMHSLNGLNVWFPDVPKVTLTFNLGPLQTLFPNAQRVNQAYAAFTPTLFMSAVAFAFFLATDVSLSVGIALYAWMLLGSLLLANGIVFDNEFDSGGKGNMLRFGAYIAMAAMILYVGRRHYLQVAASAIGLGRGDTPRYATWAARCLVLLLAGAVWLGVHAGLDPWMSAVFVGLCMLTFLVMSRIVAETGLFFVQAWWMPMSVLTALFGAEAIGPTTYITLALCSVMLVGDPRETLMPYLVNGLQMGDRTANTGPARLGVPIAVMIVLSFVVAMAVTFSFSYNRGVNHADSWSTQSLPSMPFNQLSTLTAELTATGNLADSTATSGLERLRHIRPESGAVGWLALGMTLVFATALARLRLSWWPIHPVLFLVWGTYPNSRFYFSFLLGWLIKASVVKTMGAKGYHALKPFMIGIIAGELLAGLVWMVVGGLYYGLTNQVPKYFVIFPG